ncbi:MAG: hypothetical protein Q9213_007732 [Squamulea squamosa]
MSDNSSSRADTLAMEKNTIERTQGQSDRSQYHGKPGLADTDADQADSGHNSNKFEGVLAHVNLKQAPKMAARIRIREKGLERSPKIISFLYLHLSCKIVTPALRGSYNILFPIKFRDGAQWLLKVPANGYDGWDEQSARALLSEVLTMKFIYNNSSVPVPRIYAFDSSMKNPIKCPYILMERMDGTPLHHFWFQQDSPPGSLDSLRERTLGDIAKAMVQLNAFIFPKAGSLQYNPKIRNLDVGPYRKVDFFAEYDRLGTGLDEDVTTYVEQGPFVDPKQYFLASIDEEDTTDLYHTLQAQRKLLRLLIEWFFEATSEDSSDFVLTHPDFNLQNVLVGADGSLRGFVDWDGAAAVPRCLGCEGYPLWLTPDWDPHWYNHDAEDDGADMTPKELGIYREKYAQFVEAAMREQKLEQPDPMSASERTEHTPCFSRTRVSSLARCLYIAANEPISIPYNIPMIMDKIIRLTSDKDFGPSFVRGDDPGLSGIEEESKDESTDIAKFSQYLVNTLADAEKTHGESLFVFRCEDNQYSIPTEAAVDDEVELLVKEATVEKNTVSKHLREDESTIGVNKLQLPSIESEGLQRNLGRASISAWLAFVCLCLLFPPSLFMLSMAWLQSLDVFPTAILFASLLSADTRVLSSFAIMMLAGQLFVRIIGTMFRNRRVRGCDQFKPRVSLHREQLYSPTVRSQGTDDGDSRNPIRDASRLRTLNDTREEIIKTFNSRANNHKLTDQSVQTTRSITEFHQPCPAINAGATDPKNNERTDQSPTDSADTDAQATTAVNISDTASEKERIEQIRKIWAEDPTHDFGTFVDRDIYNALYKGNLDERRLRRLKIGFWRLLEELDGRRKEG